MRSDFVETHICKLSVILRSRILLFVLIEDLARRLSLELACTRVNRVMFINLCMESIKRVFEGDRI